MHHPARSLPPDPPEEDEERPHRWSLTELGRRIVAENLGLAWDYARCHRCGRLDEEEMRSAAFEGLCRAVALFNPTRGLRLSTYAIHWMRCCAQRMHREQYIIHIPAYLMADAGQAKLSRPARTEDERLRREEIATGFARAIGVTRHPGYSEQLTAVEDREPNDPDALGRARTRARARFNEVLKELDPRTASVLHRRRFGETLNTIGRDLGMSRERVRQIEMDGIRRARQIAASG
jgi:RNA polymerase nonessential primary-like sigma factor